MIEKVVEHIDELDQPHLKLIIMHNFMWALMEEWASNRAHAHQIRNEDMIYGSWTLRSMTSPRVLLTEPFDSVNQWFANM